VCVALLTNVTICVSNVEYMPPKLMIDTFIRLYITLATILNYLRHWWLHAKKIMHTYIVPLLLYLFKNEGDEFYILTVFASKTSVW